METKQGIDYLRCSTSLAKLSSLLMEQLEGDSKSLISEISDQSGDCMYWLYKLYDEYLDQSKFKNSIDKYKDGE